MPNQNRRLFWEKLFIVKLQFQKRSALELVSRTIPQSGGYDTPQRTRELFSRIALGFIPVIIIALFGLLSTRTIAASFDCYKASRWQEKIVCSNPELSKSDDQLAKAYHDALASLSPAGQKETKQYQRQWLKEILYIKAKDEKFYGKDNANLDKIIVMDLEIAYIERTAQLTRILIKFPDRIFRRVYVSHSITDKSCPHLFRAPNRAYLQIENPCNENEKFWNNFISKKAIDHFRTSHKCPEINDEYDVTLSNKHLISVKHTRAGLSDRAAENISWLLEDKRTLQASDLFDDKTDWRNKLTALVAQKVKEKEAKTYDPKIYEQALSELSYKVISPIDWMISKDGLGFGFVELPVKGFLTFITIDWKTLDPYLSKKGHSLIYD